MRRTVATVVLPIICGTLLQGCELGQWVKNGFKVGPNYAPPAVPMASNFIDYQTPASPTTAPAKEPDIASWWDVFNDPVLNSLEHDAYNQSLTLRSAGERIIAARANRDISIGNLFPQTQQASGSYTWNKATDRGNFQSKDQWYQNSAVGVNVGWEIDFWGRFRRALESSDASLDASVADYDNVMVILLSDVATDYIQYRTFQQRLSLARQNVEIQRQAFELAQANFKAGATTERDVQQAKQAYEQTRALIPQFELGIRQNNNDLCVLLGIPVQDLAGRIGETGTIPTAPAEVFVGIPADLLRRRPDVREAERLAARKLLIGVQESALYPHFSLNGSIGVNAETFAGMFHTPGSLTGGFGPSFQWDILNYGRLENAVTVQEAVFRDFILRYQQAVLNANEEAENAIISFAKNKEQAEFEVESVAAAQRTVQITYDQYRHGAIDFTPVFLFETTLTQQQDDLAVTQGNIVLSVVNLYRSLGGGWEARLQPGGIVGPPTTAPSTQPATIPADKMLMQPTTNPATNPS